jgi:flagellar protein FlgJ
MTAPTKFYADFGSLSTLKGAAKNQDPKALREAARQFESLFTQMMLKNMRQASSSLPGGDSMMDNDQSKMYLEMFDNQLSLQLSKGRGLGLANMLVRQLSQGALAGDVDATPASPKSTASAGMPLTKSQAAGFKLINKSEGPVYPVPKSRAPTVPTLPPASHAATEGEGKQVCGSSVPSPIASPSLGTENSKWTPTSVWQLPVPAATGAKQIESTPAADQAAQEQIEQSSSAVQPVTGMATSAPEQSSLRPQPLAKDAADFVRQLWPHAQKAARELGVDAKTLIAHAALETGWGKFVPCNPDGTCSFNLFGIKAGSRWQGASTAVNTLEYEGGVAVKKRASFRTYDSAADSFRDYASFIKNSPRYAAAVGAGGNSAAFASALQQGGYATDPLYATKLAAVAARLDAMPIPKALPQSQGNELKVADNLPLSTGRRVPEGDKT